MPPSPTGTALVPGCGGPQPPAGRTQPHGDPPPAPPAPLQRDAGSGRLWSRSPPPGRAGPGRGSPGSGQRAPEAAPAGPGPATGGRAGAALCVTAVPSPSPAAHQLSSSSSSSDWVLSELQCRHHMAGPGRSGGRGAGQRHHSRPAAQPRPAPARSPQRPRARRRGRACGGCACTAARAHAAVSRGTRGARGRAIPASAARLTAAGKETGQGNGVPPAPPASSGVSAPCPSDSRLLSVKLSVLRAVGAVQGLLQGKTRTHPAQRLPEATEQPSVRGGCFIARRSVRTRFFDENE